MDSNTTTTTTTYVPAPANRGMFGTKTPSTVAFAVAILLFFMPFVDIKCNNMSLQQVKGFELATGFQMKKGSSNNPYLDDIKSDRVDDEITKATTKSDKKDPNLYAMIALGLGVLGLLLSLTNAEAAIGGAMVTGIASAGAMIGLMLDIKKKVKMDIPSMNGGKNKGDGSLSDKMNELGDKMSDFGKELGDKMNITVDFTPWFYISVIAFLAAAFFCYKRMQTKP